MKPSIAVVIPTFNNKDRLRWALETWRKMEYTPFTLIVVNDGCTDGTTEMLQHDFPEVVQLFGDGNLWFAGSCNVGLHYAVDHEFKFATVFNDDNYPEPGLLTSQVDCAARHPGAMIGVKSYKLGTNKVIWAVGGFMVKKIVGKGMHWVGKNDEDDGLSYQEEFACDMLDGSGQFYPVDIFETIGFWDERYKTYYADIEFSYRARRKGCTIISNPNAVVWHDYVESKVIEEHKKRYKFTFLYLLANKKSSYNIANMMRFWFEFFPFSAPVIILRLYANMIKDYYIDPLSNRRGAIR